jgi:hypothetical protein
LIWQIKIYSLKLADLKDITKNCQLRLLGATIIYVFYHNQAALDIVIQGNFDFILIVIVSAFDIPCTVLNVM